MCAKCFYVVEYNVYFEIIILYNVKCISYKILDPWNAGRFFSCGFQVLRPDSGCVIRVFPYTCCMMCPQIFVLYLWFNFYSKKSFTQGFNSWNVHSFSMWNICHVFYTSTTIENIISIILLLWHLHFFTFDMQILACRNIFILPFRRSTTRRQTEPQTNQQR